MNTQDSRPAQPHKTSARPLVSIALQLDMRLDLSHRIIEGLSRYLAENRNWPVRPRLEEMDTREAFVDPPPCDGLITHITSPAQAQRLCASGVPVVNIAGQTRPDQPIYTVQTDFQRAGKLAAEFLLKRGYQSFGVCLPVDRSSHAEAANAGFEARVKQDGFDCLRLDRQYLAHKRGKELRAAIARMLQSLEHRTALLAAWDSLAAHITRVAAEQGIFVPEDVAVIGLGDERRHSELARPQITSVDTAQVERGYVAADILRRLLEGKTVRPYERLVEPRRVIERQSTRLLNTDDPEVISAMRFIREHADVPINVDDVMEWVTCSRRTLEYRFERELGSTIHQEIWRAHVDLAKQILAETELDLIEVAMQSGFASRSTFSHVFRSRTGTTPTRFRREHRAMPR